MGCDRYCFIPYKEYKRQKQVPLTIFIGSTAPSVASLKFIPLPLFISFSHWPYFFLPLVFINLNYLFQISTAHLLNFNRKKKFISIQCSFIVIVIICYVNMNK